MNLVTTGSDNAEMKMTSDQIRAANLIDLLRNAIRDASKTGTENAGFKMTSNEDAVNNPVDAGPMATQAAQNPYPGSAPVQEYYCPQHNGLTYST